MDSFTLTLKQDNFPFNQNPRFVDLSADKILLNNVVLPQHIDKESAYNPHNVQLWVIGHEFGAVCAVWASHAQEALDEACNAGFMECFSLESHEESDDFAFLGNDSTPHDLTYVWTGAVEFDAARDIALILAIVRAVENQKTTIDA